MNAMLLLDNIHMQAARALSPIYSIFDLTRVGEISSTFILPNTSVTILCNWINEGIDEL
jgi:hypothetical protein